MYRRRGNRGLGGFEITESSRGDIQPKGPEESGKNKDITELVSVEGFFDFFLSLLCNPQAVNHSAFLQLLNQAISENNPQKNLL